MNKYASYSAVLYKQASALRQQAAMLEKRADAAAWLDTAKNFLASDTAKSIGAGLIGAGGTYAATSLFDPQGKHRAKRLLASLLVGGGAAAAAPYAYGVYDRVRRGQKFKDALVGQWQHGTIPSDNPSVFEAVNYSDTPEAKLKAASRANLQQPLLKQNPVLRYMALNGDLGKGGTRGVDTAQLLAPELVGKAPDKFTPTPKAEPKMPSVFNQAQ